jgi:hypothetical protein
MTGDQPCPINLLATQEIYAEGNMATITETIPINIFRNPGVMENVFVGADCSPKEIQIYTDIFKEFRDVFSWSYEEIPGIDLNMKSQRILMPSLFDKSFIQLILRKQQPSRLRLRYC